MLASTAPAGFFNGGTQASGDFAEQMRTDGGAAFEPGDVLRSARGMPWRLSPAGLCPTVLGFTAQPLCWPR
jgi:hypothetical protein